MSSSTSTSLNLSILAIPAFWMISLGPHALAVFTARDHWDNANPRSTANLDRVSKRLPATTWKELQRCEAASANGLENLPLFAAAVLAGNLANLPLSGVEGATAWWELGGGLNGFAMQTLLLRAAYNVAYVKVGGYAKGFIRSSLWLAMVVMSVKVLYQAAKVL